jgi:hypothetical protein
MAVVLKTAARLQTTPVILLCFQRDNVIPSPKISNSDIISSDQILSVLLSHEAISTIVNFSYLMLHSLSYVVAYVNITSS